MLAAYSAAVCSRTVRLGTEHATKCRRSLSIRRVASEPARQPCPARPSPHRPCLSSHGPRMSSYVLVCPHMSSYVLICPHMSSYRLTISKCLTRRTPAWPAPDAVIDDATPRWTDTALPAAPPPPSQPPRYARALSHRGSASHARVRPDEAVPRRPCRHPCDTPAAAAALPAAARGGHYRHRHRGARPRTRAAVLAVRHLTFALTRPLSPVPSLLSPLSPPSRGAARQATSLAPGDRFC